MIINNSGLKTKTKQKQEGGHLKEKNLLDKPLHRIILE